MAFTLKLSDGVTTIDFLSGDVKLREGGIEMPPPNTDAEFSASPFVDGDRMASSRYGNRTISLRLKLFDTSHANLLSEIRAIHQLLNDAEKRTLLGYGAKVYLEYQWGTTAGQSVYFDVLRGNLSLPAGFQSVILSIGYGIIDARLDLICKPFGRFTNQDIAQDTLENSQSIATTSISSLSDNLERAFGVYGASRWLGQTFTTIGAISAIRVMLRMGKVGIPGTVTLRLYDTAAGKPTGAALATVTFDGNQLPLKADGIYMSVVVTISQALSAATQYALIASCAGADSANSVFLRVSNANPYAGGTLVYTIDGGANWTIEAAEDCVFAIYIGETSKLNYQDITTTAAFGDVPARLYAKLVLTGAAGSKKMWLSKRSGTRQTDDLWLDVNDVAGFTNVIGGAHTITSLPNYVANEANESGQRVNVKCSGAIAIDNNLSYVYYNLATPPRGQFRVLVKAQCHDYDAANFAYLGFGVGWSYGNKTYVPSRARGEYKACSAEDVPEILDLGVLAIPPIAESDIASNSTFQLRIYQGTLGTLSDLKWYEWDIIFIFLLPIDEGAVILNSVASTDIVAMDGITDPKQVYFLDDANKITFFPDYYGKPFTLGRESTRIYVLRDDVKAVTLLSDIKYQPQFLLA